MWRLKLCPEKFVEEYIISKQQKYRNKVWPMLVGADITLAHHRKKFRAADHYLKVKRERYIEQRVELDEKWEEVASEGEKLKENFIHFNNFLLANAEKRKRTSETIAELKSLNVQRATDIEDIKIKIEFLKSSKDELEAEINKHIMFEHYLYNVLSICEKGEGFINVHSFIEKYEYLTEINRSLAEKQQEQFNTLQEAKIELSKFFETNENILMGLHTQSAGLQGRFEEVSRKSRRLEYLIRRINDSAHEMYNNISFTKQAIRNLYRLMCRKKDVPVKLAVDNFEEQLLFISKTIGELHKLNAMINKTPPRRVSLKRDLFKLS